MLSINPKEISTGKLHGYLLGAVAPRPIAFASTIDEKGIPNLSPFSFFNVFGSNPPMMIFSPARRVRGNTTKHTLQNVEKIKEVVLSESLPYEEEEVETLEEIEVVDPNQVKDNDPEASQIKLEL